MTNSNLSTTISGTVSAKNNQLTHSLAGTNLVLIIVNKQNQEEVYQVRLSITQSLFPFNFITENLNGIKSNDTYHLTLLIFGHPHRLLWEAAYIEIQITTNVVNYINFVVIDVSNLQTCLNKNYPCSPWGGYLFDVSVCCDQYQCISRGNGSNYCVDRQTGFLGLNSTSSQLSTMTATTTALTTITTNTATIPTTTTAATLTTTVPSINTTPTAIYTSDQDSPVISTDNKQTLSQSITTAGIETSTPVPMTTLKPFIKFITGLQSTEQEITSPTFIELGIQTSSGAQQPTSISPNELVTEISTNPQITALFSITDLQQNSLGTSTELGIPTSSGAQQPMSTSFSGLETELTITHRETTSFTLTDSDTNFHESSLSTSTGLEMQTSRDVEQPTSISPTELVTEISRNSQTTSSFPFTGVSAGINSNLEQSSLSASAGLGIQTLSDTQQPTSISPTELVTEISTNSQITTWFPITDASAGINSNMQQSSLPTSAGLGIETSSDGQEITSSLSVLGTQMTTNNRETTPLISTNVTTGIGANLQESSLQTLTELEMQTSRNAEQPTSISPTELVTEISTNPQITASFSITDVSAGINSTLEQNSLSASTGLETQTSSAAQQPTLIRSTELVTEVTTNSQLTTSFSPTDAGTEINTSWHASLSPTSMGLRIEISTDGDQTSSISSTGLGTEITTNDLRTTSFPFTDASTGMNTNLHESSLETTAGLGIQTLNDTQQSTSISSTELVTEISSNSGVTTSFPFTDISTGINSNLQQTTLPQLIPPGSSCYSPSPLTSSDIIWSLKESGMSYPTTYIQNFMVYNETCFMQGIIGYRSAIQLSAALQEYVTMDYPYDFRNTDFSITAWIYLNSSRFEMTIFAQCNSHIVSQCLFLRITNMQMQFGFYNSDTTGNKTLNINQWYHVAFVYNFTAQMQMVYLDGIINGENPSRVYNGAPCNITIGRAKQDANTYFDGLIDRISIVNRTLTADEVLEEATLSAYYSFDISIETDSGPNQNNGSGYNVNLMQGSPSYLQFSTQGRSSYFQAENFLFLGGYSHSYSFSFWIYLYPAMIQSGSIISIISENSSCSVILGFDRNSNIVAQDLNNNVLRIVGVALPSGIWTYIALTYQYNQDITLYFDGISIGSMTPAINAFIQSPVTLRLGFLNSQTTCSGSPIVPGITNGAIDEFRIYSRCLTDTDIQTIHQMNH